MKILSLILIIAGAVAALHLEAANEEVNKDVKGYIMGDIKIKIKEEKRDIPYISKVALIAVITIVSIMAIIIDDQVLVLVVPNRLGDSGTGCDDTTRS